MYSFGEEDGEFRYLSCDTTCQGHAWLSTWATFILGVLIIFAMDFIVGLISPAAHEELEVEHLDKLQQINNTVTANGDSMSNHRENGYGKRPSI